METRTKTFDAVAESRKWREATSRKLNAMSQADRLAYLKVLGVRVRAELRPGRPMAPSAPSNTAAKTNPKAFDAVIESRKWREATGRKLAAMTLEERIAYLNSAKERLVQQKKESSVSYAEQSGIQESCVLREEPPKK